MFRLKDFYQIKSPPPTPCFLSYLTIFIPFDVNACLVLGKIYRRRVHLHSLFNGITLVINQYVILERKLAESHSLIVISSLEQATESTFVLSQIDSKILIFEGNTMKI